MGGTFQNTPPGNAVRGFYEVSKVLPFPEFPPKIGAWKREFLRVPTI